MQAHFAGGVDCTLAPQSDCATPDAALDRAGIGAGRAPPLPADALRRRCAAPRAAPGWDRSDRAARAGRCRASRPARRSPAPARRRPAVARSRAWRDPRPALMNTSDCADGEIRAGVERLGEVADAGADADAGRAVVPAAIRGQRAVAARADAQALPGRRPVAGVELLFLAVVARGAPARAPGATGPRRAPVVAGADLEPKPPPMASTITRTRLSGRPNVSASSRRTPAVYWVDINRQSSAASRPPPRASPGSSGSGPGCGIRLRRRPRPGRNLRDVATGPRFWARARCRCASAAPLAAAGIVLAPHRPSNTSGASLRARSRCRPRMAAAVLRADQAQRCFGRGRCGGRDRRDDIADIQHAPRGRCRGGSRIVAVPQPRGLPFH